MPFLRVSGTSGLGYAVPRAGIRSVELLPAPRMGCEICLFDGSVKLQVEFASEAKEAVNDFVQEVVRFQDKTDDLDRQIHPPALVRLYCE